MTSTATKKPDTGKLDLKDHQVISDATTMLKEEFMKKYKGQATDGMLSLSWHNLRKQAGEKPAAGEKKAKPEKAAKPEKEKKEKVVKEKKESVPQAGVEEFQKDAKVKEILTSTASKSEKMRHLFDLGNVTIDGKETPITPSVVSKLLDAHYSFVYGVYQRWKNPEEKEEKETKPAKKEAAPKKEDKKDEKPAKKTAKKKDEEAVEETNDAIADRLADEEAAEEEVEETIEEVVEEPKKKAPAKKAAAKKK